MTNYIDLAIKEIERACTGLKWVNLTGLTVSKYALLSNQKLGNLIIKLIGDKNIEESKIPLAFVATNI